MWIPTELGGSLDLASGQKGHQPSFAMSPLANQRPGCASSGLFTRQAIRRAKLNH